MGVTGHQQVTLRTWITDRHGERYGVREPLEAEEVGQVYRLFLREHMPTTVSELDRHLIALDGTEHRAGKLAGSNMSC